jgi:uncharacterized protein YjbJ (UPF0337 family)
VFCKGAADKLGGKMEEGWGKLTGTKSMEANGKMKRARGNIKEGWGQAERNIDDAVDDMRDPDETY